MTFTYSWLIELASPEPHSELASSKYIQTVVEALRIALNMSSSRELHPVLKLPRSSENFESLDLSKAYFQHMGSGPNIESLSRRHSGRLKLLHKSSLGSEYICAIGHRISLSSQHESDCSYKASYIQLIVKIELRIRLMVACVCGLRIINSAPRKVIHVIIRETHARNAEIKSYSGNHESR